MSVDDRVLGEERADPAEGVRGHAQTLLADRDPFACPTRVTACPPPAAASPWSRWAARATRWTPRSWPAASRPRAGHSSRTPLMRTSRSSTPAGSSSRRRRTRSTPCSRPPTSSGPAAPAPSSRSGASPSATARPWPTSCRMPTPCSDSTPTGRCPATSRLCWTGSDPHPTCRRTGAGCFRWRPPTAPAAGQPCRRRGHGDGGDAGFVRARLDARPWAPLKIASGCDRRCSFCAIPMFRGSFVSRRPTDVVAEARWLASQGVQELFLVERELDVVRQGPR